MVKLFPWTQAKCDAESEDGTIPGKGDTIYWIESDDVTDEEKVAALINQIEMNCYPDAANNLAEVPEGNDPSSTAVAMPDDDDRAEGEDEEEDEDAKKKRLEREMWDVVFQEDDRTPWSELPWWRIVLRIIWIIIEISLVCGFLYIFICSIDVLGDGFQILGGRSAGEAFTQDSLLNNPICGLMLGVLCTALLQSSSTTTSIVVTMVGTGIITVQQAIPIIMGANIGTSVTSTIVAMGQAMERNEFRRAMAGATVNDMFNWLAVLILLPIEVLTDMLYYLTSAMVKDINSGTSDNDSPKFLKAITEPLTELIIKVDSQVVTAVSVQHDYQKRSLVAQYCTEINIEKEEIWPLGQQNETFVETIDEAYWPYNVELFNRTENATIYPDGETVLSWTDVIHNESTDCVLIFVGEGMPDSNLSEAAVGGILVCGSLVVLLLSIFLMVKVLQDLFKGAAARAVCKVLNADFPKYLGWLTGYVAMTIGIVFTILVQSSSVFTSILTPLVGAGLITVERMYPLTLGANIGTTFTSLLAAMTNEGQGLQDALQISFVHLMFNVFGICIWYPVPLMRRAPVWLAKFLGNTTAEYRWFPIAYLLFMFLLFPLSIFALSLGGPAVLMGVLIPITVFIIVLVIINVMQRKKPEWLPKRLQNWDWIPLWMHSLQPYDECFVKCCTCKCCRRCKNVEDEEEVEDDSVNEGDQKMGHDNIMNTFSGEDEIRDDMTLGEKLGHDEIMKTFSSESKAKEAKPGTNDNIRENTEDDNNDSVEVQHVDLKGHTNEAFQLQI